MKSAVKKIMSTEEDINLQDVEEMMKEADMDGNGQLDYKEWFRLFTEPNNLNNKWKKSKCLIFYGSYCKLEEINIKDCKKCKF